MSFTGAFIDFVLIFCLNLLILNSNGVLTAERLRVNNLKLVFSTENGEFSVPILPKRNFNLRILNSKTFHVALIKQSGNYGEKCQSNQFVTEPIDPYKTVGDSVYFGLNELHHASEALYVCLSTTDDGISWIHLGKAAKILPSVNNTRSKRDYGYEPGEAASPWTENASQESSSKSVSKRSHPSPINEVHPNHTRKKSSNNNVEKSARTLYYNQRNKSDIRTSLSGLKVPLLSSFNVHGANSSDLSDNSSVLNTTVLNSSKRLEKKENILLRVERFLNESDAANSSAVSPSVLTPETAPGKALAGPEEVSPPEESPTEKSSSSMAAQGSDSIRAIKVNGIRAEEPGNTVSYVDGVIEIQAGHEALIRLFGTGLESGVAVQFTAEQSEFGDRCDVKTSQLFEIEAAHGEWALVHVTLPAMSAGQRLWHLCVRERKDAVAVHQGPHTWLAISTYSRLLPIWIQAIILLFLLVLSGLFSGLNLGLMALDKTELKIVMNTGTPTERDYAKSIEPVRRHGNFLLCTLLLGNVLVNSSLTILLDTLSSGLIAVIGSTIGIVIFGEIVPQAICSRHGLAIGAKTVWLVRIFMVITGLVSWPISKLLDCVLGEEIGNTYDRDRLKELIRVTQDRNDIRLEEQNIIYGALELHRKTCAEVMTKLEDIFMLSIESNLDFNTINEIMQQGYSRIPIYEGERTNILSFLLIKDLAFIDPDDNTPLRTVVQYYQNDCNYFFEDTTLDVIFKEFKHGNKGHMAFVHRVNNEGDCDPFYEVVGLVTLEDVIEELIQEEIVDETDVFTDNKSKRRRKQIRRDFKEFSQHLQNISEKRVQISPQLQVAALQFLRTTVEPFKDGQLSEGILKKMLNQDIIHVIKDIGEPTSKTDIRQYLYQQGKPSDYFILILEGHVSVTIGKESMKFESGPFSYFGLAALCAVHLGDSPSLSQVSRGSIQSLEATKYSFTPDYTVRPSSVVTFLRLRRTHYIAARRAYLVEQSQKGTLAVESFEKEMEKILRDESQSSPLWNEAESAKESLKEGAPNGGSTTGSRSQSGEPVEVPPSSDDRKFSLKEIFPLKTFCNPGGSMRGTSLPPGVCAEEVESVDKDAPKEAPVAKSEADD